jgi:hypothetical protein
VVKVSGERRCDPVRRLALAAESRDDPLQVVEEEGGQFRAEAVSNDDPDNGDVLEVGGHLVGRDDPAPGPQRLGDVEDGVVGRVAQAEDKGGDAASVGENLERAERIDSGGQELRRVGISPPR